MRVERSLIDYLATRDVNQDHIFLHQAQFAGADQSLGGGRQRGADVSILTIVSTGCGPRIPPT